MRIAQHDGLRVLHLDPEGPVIATPADGAQLVGDAFGHDAGMVVVPVSRLDPDFFQLRSGLAGEVMQKMVNYHVRLAVIGDIGAYTEASNALRDLVRETNEGSHTWFLPDEDALAARLGPELDA